MATAEPKPKSTFDTVKDTVADIGMKIFGGGMAGAAGTEIKERPKKLDEEEKKALGYKRGGVVSRSGGFRPMTTTMKRGRSK